MLIRILFLVLISTGALAQTNIDVQLEVPSKYSIYQKFADKQDEVCRDLKALPYTKGKISCRSHLRERDATIVVTMKSEGNEWLLTARHFENEAYNAGWKIPQTKDGLTELAMARRLIENYASAIETERFLEEMYLTAAAKSSGIIGLDKNNNYIEKNSNLPLSFEEAREKFYDEHPKHRYVWLAVLNFSLVFASRAAWHWTDRDRQYVDWEYTYHWSSFRERLLSAPSFDADEFNKNALRSPMMNAAVHLGSRAAGLSFAESFLLSFASSILWEYLAEFNEKISVNDLVLPPLAGSIVGEVTYRLSSYLVKKGKRALAQVFKRKGGVSDYGLDEDVITNFEFYAGQTMNQFGTYLSLEGSSYALKNYLKAGDRLRVYRGGDVSLLELEGIIGKEGVENFRLFAQTSLIGIQRERIRMVDGKKRGYSVLVGLASSYDYSQTQYGSFYDKIGVLNVLGSTAEINYFHKGLHIRAEISVSGHVSQIKSASVNRLEGHFYDLQETKYVLETQKYYFAYGMTVSGRAGLEYKNFALNAEYRYISAQSINGIDRYQELVSDDFSISDTRSTLDINASYTFFKRFLVSIGYQLKKATGKTRDESDSHRENYFYGRLGVKF